MTLFSFKWSVEFHWVCLQECECRVVHRGTGTLLVAILLWKMPFFLRESTATYKSSGRSGVSWTPPHSLAGCWQAQLCADCYEIKNAAIMHIWKAMFRTFPCFPLSYILSHPISYKLYLSLGMDDIDTPLMVEHSTVNYFHLFEQSWTSNVTISHCKKKLLRPKLTSMKSIWA